RDIAYILDSLPTRPEAQSDQQSSKPYVGIDLFYDKDGSVKGLVFATQSRALIIRVPDNAAKTSAIWYEKKLLAEPEDKPRPIPRTKFKGQKQAKPLPEKTAYERLRELLDVNLAAFGMAQISLTLWDTLRERVDGVNLSTVASETIPPPYRRVPAPSAPADDGETEDGVQANKGKGGRGEGRRGGKGGQRGRSRGDRSGGRGRGRDQNDGDEKQDHNSNSEKKPKMIRVPALPEDKEDCRDRDLQSPGQIFNGLFRHVSPMRINSLFFGQDRVSDMDERVAEAISRAWVAHLVANHDELNSAVQKAPVIKPSELNDEELTFFSKSMVAAWRVMGEEEADRAVEKEDIRGGGTNQIVSQSHKKRIRASKFQEIRLLTKDDQEMTLYGRKDPDDAKAVRLVEDEISPNKEESSKSERQTEDDPHKGRKNGHRQHVFKDLPGDPDEFAFDAGRPLDGEESDLGEQPLFDMDNINMVPKLKGKINPSQLKVIGRVTAPNPKGRTRATLVHGPPGTGKTSTITAAAIRLVKSGEYVWIVAQSNVGISNVAGKLRDIEFDDFVLIVAEEYYSWWEGQYENLKPYVVRTRLLKTSEKRFRGKKLILCTLASLSNRLVENLVMYQHVPLRNLIIDEASQIDMTSEFMHLFFKHRYVLKNVCWFGDPMQLPPYGWSEMAKINDIFKVEHLQANSKLMDTSYRLPIPIAEFISKEVYKNELKPFLDHEVKTPTEALLFIDTPKGEELKEDPGTSFMNLKEAELVVQIVELYYNKEDKRTGKPYEFTVITPYEAQRKLVQSMLKNRGIDKAVYNVDSFQGNEADYIITTLTKTTLPSFLSSINRLNVLLTRCKRGLVVISKKDFIIRTGGLLRGLWWAYESHNIWKDADEVGKGYVDLPGSPAPCERPEEESE
ncbi:hypothetical protein FRC11_010918, partial [Ceratobasidium sp. 423]